MGEKKSSAAKKIRIAQIVLFMVLIYFLTMTFGYQKITQAGKDAYYHAPTGFNLIFGEKLKFDAPGYSGWAYSVLLIIPAAACLTACFDANRNIKNLVGLLASIGGIIAILNLIGSAIAIGSLLSLFVYLITAFISVLGFFANLQQNAAETEGKRLGQ